MIRAPEREAPLMLGEQNGEVHFVNDNPPIMYIKGSDDQFYVTNDRETVDRFLEFHSLDKLRSVRFCGLILGDNRTACFLKNGIGYEVGSDPLEEANYHVVSEPIYQPYQGREWETESSSEWYPQPFYTAQCPTPPTALPPPPRSLSPPRQPNTQQAKVTRFLSPEPVCIRSIPRNAPTPPIPPPVRRSESPVFTADIPSPQPSLLDVDDWADRITSSSPTWPPTDFTFSAQHKLIVQQVRRMSASSANNESYSLPLPAPNPPPQDFWEQSDHEIEAIIDELSDQQLHILLNKWYRIPKKFNRDAYPYPCEGFVVPNSDNKTILIFTRRLGCLTLPENPNRKGRLYAYFLVCGPGIYKAWEFDSSPPPSFKSTKYVNTSNVEMKGYGLMSPGRRDDSESLWYVWNDQTGLMQCLASCARELKNKYYDWTPTCQMVMFDATSEDNGRNWKVKTISFVGYPTAERLSIFPQQVYYIKNLRVLPSNQQPNPAKEVVFYSSFLNDHVHVRVAHILDKTVTITLERLYNAVVFASWGNNGQSRRFQGLVAGSEPVLNQLTRPSFAKLSSLLEPKYWDRESEEHQKNVVQEPEVNLLF